MTGHSVTVDTQQYQPGSGMDSLWYLSGKILEDFLDSYVEISPSNFPTLHKTTQRERMCSGSHRRLLFEVAIQDFWVLTIKTFLVARTTSTSPWI